MNNRCEKRIALFRGKAKYLVRINRRPNNSQDFGLSTEDLFFFAETALRALCQSMDGIIFDGLVRVDVFKTKTGRLVVNEFESLEAAYYCTSHLEEMKMNCNLEKYWIQNILQAMKIQNNGNVIIDDSTNSR
jgi:hypothetical protein